MMRSGIIKYLLIVLIFSSIICSPLPAVEIQNNQQPVRSITDLKESFTRNIPFKESSDLVSVELPDGVHKLVHVELKEVGYEYTLINQTASKTISNPRSYYCYELESKDKSIPYNWYICLDNCSAGMFKLFTTQNGDTYLAWVDHWSLFIAEASKSMRKSGKLKSLNDLINSRRIANIRCILVSNLFGQDQFVDMNTTAHYASIYLESIEKEGKDELRLQIHGKDSSKIYTLITDKKAQFGGWLIDCGKRMEAYEFGSVYIPPSKMYYISAQPQQ